MAGEERGGVFAFIVLTIALSVAVTLGIALVFMRAENTRLRDVHKAYQETSIVNKRLVDERGKKDAEIKRLKDEIRILKKDGGS
jgi:hypothetical protein